ncbi:MAG TPA: glucan biosynthesis glucosyltransferase H, partial [Paracoccaceae bacterium]
RGFGSTVTELALSSITAPIFLMYQTRSVLQVLLGRDGGWPANNRGDGTLSLAESWAASRWITALGLVGLALTHQLAPALLAWMLPVAVPMVLSPVIIQWLSGESRAALFTVPTEQMPPPVLARHDAWLARWAGSAAPEPAPESTLAQPEALHV